MKKLLSKWAPALLMFVMALWFFGDMQPPKDPTFAFNEFGRLPVIFNGRVKPIDSVARNALLQIREKQTLNTEPWKEWNQKPHIITASEWLAYVMMVPQIADEWPVFRIDNPDAVSLLKLPEKGDHSDGKHFSWNQITTNSEALEVQFQRVAKVNSTDRTPFDRAIAKLHEGMNVYAQLKNTLQPEVADSWADELAAFEKMVPEGVAAAKAQQAHEKYDEKAFNQFAAFISAFQYMSRLEPPLALPPAPGTPEWRRVGDALLAVPQGRPLDESISIYARMGAALAAEQPRDFNAAVKDMESRIVAGQQTAIAKARAEQFFNQMQPFYHAMVLYVLAGLIAVFFWFNLSELLRRSAVWLLWLALAIHTTGLIYRMVLEGRPPVTNLYSSAIFIGWGACVLGLILERFHRNGIGAVVASGIGFTTLIIAQHLALEGDTMEMMRAVLDTNFWLATHVVAVTVGYASTFVAGFLALIYILRGFFTKTLDQATGKSLGRMIYGIVCFATLFSFVGTVLGGIWADQSWGRFWGWDPKENGALIIVLWNALILHLRWGGLIRERGLAICAIGGNIVTSWSWFGVNMLGIGLHSYGFTDAAFKWLLAFVASQMILIALGLLPGKFWRSTGSAATAS